MRRSTGTITRLAAVALLTMPMVARADVVVGSFNGAGSVGLSAPAFPNVSLTFSGPIIAVPTLDGIFAPIAPGTLGAIQNVTVGSGAFAIPNFITLAGYTFSLAQIAAGSFSPALCAAPAAVGQNCSEPGSGINYSNISNGSGGISSTLSFAFSGLVTTPGATVFNYTGTFSAQFTGMSYQQLLGSLTAGQTTPTSYSLSILATIPTTTTPEPTSLALMGTGLLGICVAARRRRRTDA